MKIAEKTVYPAIVAVLVISIAVLGCALLRKDREYKEINAKLYDNIGSLEELTEQIEQYKQELEEYSAQIADEKKNNSDLQSKLDAAEREKKRLEEDNAGLRKQIEQLAAKKKAESLASVLAMGTNLQSGEKPTDKVCYLTFDDGPSDNTLRILEILKEYNDIKATFFVVGTSRLEYLPQIHAAGHTVGLHSSTHKYDQIYSSEAAFLTDLQSVQVAVEQRIGIKSNVVRFPGGSSNEVSKRYCTGIMTQLTQRLPSIGYAYFDWNVSSCDADGKNRSASYISRTVLQQAENKTSICVLMHDTSAKNATVEALPTVIEGLIQMGFKFEVLTAESYGFHHPVKN